MPESPESPRTLVLWDVDHTLIETRGVGRAIYDRAFPAATGKALANLAEISGRTELDIMAESLRINGIEPDAVTVGKLAAALVQGYETRRRELATISRALPGADDTLTAFAAEPRIHQGVLTGNLREVARIKLEVFGLDRYLDLDSSAYGDDDRSRPALVTIAQQRARNRTGEIFDNGHTVLIGDTVNDVQAALTAGVRVVGVATGKTTATALHDAGAQIVVEKLTPALRELILNR
ncbi:HAD hydrolase-like protein [Amycolatopsis sp. K13G38]|uniref:HAD hydrolase-like protein n=1 Tax=Amycolatopsis acididurans TaxID=2724524 RepID=A0ABX1JFF8_9PSEU|nr:HAD hydrolase-like protein [Amycolatopsis acididurans]NKQ58530.1 HAD hydrolase-like protein [Amycolatopsis acididurans]